MGLHIRCLFSVTAFKYLMTFAAREQRVASADQLSRYCNSPNGCLVGWNNHLVVFGQLVVLSYITDLGKFSLRASRRAQRATNSICDSQPG